MARKRLFQSALLLVLVMSSRSVCHAGTIGPNGESVSLSLSESGSQFTVLLSINTTTSGFRLDGAYLDSVGIKTSNIISAARLDSVFSNGADVTSDFALYINSGVAAGGCTGAGNGFVCIKVADPHLFSTPAVMTFIFTVTTGAHGANVLDTVKALYISNNGKQKVRHISSLYVSVPEPAVLSLLLTALGVLPILRRLARR